ncbi:MAG: hypothetical protein LBI42_06265 [Chitinispirillales bacterium]|jgi:hypothetical protein|nr:hypothetical protein [Chitinispirillales bacterium]
MRQIKWMTALAFICHLPQLLLAQVDNFGIQDDHFHGILFPQIYKELVSTKVNYPGLRNPENYSVSAGLLPNAAGESFAAVYGWGEWPNGPATAGVWLGNVQINNKSYWETLSGYEYGIYTSENIFSFSGAAWFTPFRSNIFRGISLTYNTKKESREEDYDNGSLISMNDRDTVFLNIISLIRLNTNFHIRTGISSQSHNISLYSNDYYRDGFFVGLLDKDNRALELHISNSFDRTDDFYGELINDTVHFNLLFSGGKVAQYHKHRLFYGVKAKAGASFISETGADADRFEYFRHMRSMTNNGRVISATLSAPLIFDIRIFRNIRGMLSINPQINYEHKNHPEKPEQSFSLKIPEPLLSFYGGIGDKVEFAFKPSIENDVFISAVEAKYRF